MAIGSKREAKRQRRLQLVIAFIVIGLMVTSVLGIITGRDGESEGVYKHNGYKFQRVENVYVTRIGDIDMYFFSLPDEAGIYDISTDAVLALRNAQYVVLLFDPEDPDIRFVEQIRYDLYKFIGKLTKSAVTNTSPNFPDMEVKSCSDATQTMPVIFFNNSNSSTVTFDNYCILINGNSADYLKLRDGILYKLYGILE